MSTSIALLCEGKSDPRVVRALADLTILKHVTWFDPDEIDTHRHYRGFTPDKEFMTWGDIDDLVSAHKPKFRGQFDDLPNHRDARNTFKALVLLTLYAPDDPPIDAIIVFRDADDQDRVRRPAILTARDQNAPLIPVIVGVANPMSECWILHGFEPRDDEERARYDAEFGRVGFDPRMRAHDLTDTNEGDDRSPKRVLWALALSDHERERACLVETGQHVLRSRGEKTGLVAFLDELDERLPKAFR